MKNTHHHRDHTTTHRTPCIYLSNSHCTVFTKACVPTRHQCEPLARCNQTHRRIVTLSRPTLTTL